MSVGSNGTKYWAKDGKYHREDGPAIEAINGDKYWWVDGVFYGNYINKRYYFCLNFFEEHLHPDAFKMQGVSSQKN